ncbi:MAG TPA: tetratricopeptide repeat protein [Planctomycetes bacterium]|nr:tetratricopeptide repeat protein [Planctomycetota bacterium]
MRFPEADHFGLSDEVVPEPAAGPGRIVLWVGGRKEGRVPRWERIADLPAAGIEERGGLCAVPAALMPFEHKRAFLWERLSRWLRPRAVGHDWLTPDGRPARPIGPKRRDLLLVWSKDANIACDQEQINTHWPEAKDVRRLGKNLFLVCGVRAHAPDSEAPRQQGHESSAEAAAKRVAQLSGSPDELRQEAEKRLAAARATGTLADQAVALTDLGSVLVYHGPADVGVGHLEQAIALAHQAGEVRLEYDALAALGTGYFACERFSEAVETFQRVLEWARADGDCFGEKMMLRELGAVYARMRQPDRALGYYEAAIRLAGQLGDELAQADFAWAMAICHDELGHRHEAIRLAQAAVELYQRLRAPDSAARGGCLERLRQGDEDICVHQPYGWAPPSAQPCPPDRGRPVRFTIAGQTRQRPAGEGANHAPTRRASALRMGYTAGRSLAKSVASGFDTVSRQTRAARLKACQPSERHSHLRCRPCGCFSRQRAWHAHEGCPLGHSRL